MRNLNLITNINNRRNGYTIIEVAVVILIIGILTAISIISYGSWKQKTVATQLKSDLTMAASAMKDARTFGTSGYPSDITNVKSFKPSGNTGDVVVTGGSNDGGKTFCLSAEAPSYPSLHYHIDSTHTISEVESGTCPTYITNVAISPPTDIRVGQVLTAAVTPTGATDTATYQWRRYNSIALDNNYVVVGTSQKTYTTTSGDLAKYIRVAATGTGEYTGSVTSSHTTVVQPALSSLSGISYTGTPIVGNILTAGAPQPPSATANLQWQSATLTGGPYSDILGATSLTYTIPASQAGKYIRLSATGTVDYTGIVTSGNELVTIPTPSAPTVSAVTVGATTTWSWPSGTNCVAGTTARYRYDYFIDGVSQAPSGWKTPTVDTATSISFTTSTENRTYKVTVSGQCYYGTNVSAWGASGEFSYLRPITTYTLSTSVSGYGSGSITGAGTYNAGTTVTVTATPPADVISGAGIAKTIFGSWSGACSGQTTCSVVMNSNKSVNGNFEAFYPVWRLNKSGTYIYTIWDSEKSLLTNPGGWTYDGAAFGAFQYQAINTLPVYRLVYNGVYLFTISELEKNSAVTSGWVNEGVAFYAYNSLTPIRADVIRLYNGTTGKRFWSTNHAEIAGFAKPPWIDEGPGFYGFYY